MKHINQNHLHFMARAINLNRNHEIKHGLLIFCKNIQFIGKCLENRRLQPELKNTFIFT